MTLTFSGDLIEPNPTKLGRAAMTYSARAGMLNQVIGDTQRAIGSVSVRDRELSGYVFVPQERLAELAVVAHTGRVQVIRFTGTQLRYGSALIYSLSMGTEVEEDEVPAK